MLHFIIWCAGIIIGLLVRYASDDLTVKESTYRKVVNTTEPLKADVILRLIRADNGNSKNYTCQATPSTYLGSKVCATSS